MKKSIYSLCAACCLLAALATTASALEYTMDAPEAGLFGTPTSDDNQYITRDEPVNMDRSKTAAVIPPAFGSPTSYTLNSGTLLTPNLVDRDWAAQVTVSGNGTGAVVMPPALSSGAASSGSSSFAVTQYTEVTDDLYYSGGYLGTLKIPAIGLSVKVYQGTDNTTLAKGAGHFEDTSVWNGNCCIAGHNRGVRDDFGDLHTLEPGDTVTWTTKLGTRTYEVVSVEKVLETDHSGTASTTDNRITLFTCVRDQRDYRWQVQAVEVQSNLTVRFISCPAFPNIVKHD